ncbi:NAD(P)/FAD-dependent oxidoreductase [Winogradskyella sp. A3E31]|uniref:NAD(P)/FAD-dependent oxidoreductase n=1 Tax=Winogradskyella sp. A3E31 TaxID=3349637 RepID=UPI00398B92D2
MKSTVVVGGGIIGLCSAYYLHKKGHKVTVLEKSEQPTGASIVNAGYLTPSHFVPLAAPGVILQGIKWMLNSKSPFYIKPRWDIEFFKWAWAFYRSSTAKKVKKAIPVLLNFNLLSSRLFDEIKESGDLGPFHFERKGLLMLYKTEAYEAKEKEMAEKGTALNLEVNGVTKKQLQEMQPEVNVSAKGACHYHCDAHSTPIDFMSRMADYLTRSGVRIVYGEAVEYFNISEHRIQSVKTKENTYEADNVVLAAGTWSSNLAKKLGITLQIQPGKGYCINVYRPTGIKIPAILSEAKIAVTPMDGFTRFAGTMEFSGINHNINKNRVQAIADEVNTYYPEIKITEEEIDAAKCGLRPVSPDGLPYIGKVEGFENLVIATGHAMMGWSLGPGTGKLVSEIISNKQLSMDIGAFNPNRKF